MPTRLSVSRFLVWLPALAWSGLIFFLSAQPDTALKEAGLSGDLLAIVGHITVYAVLMVLLFLALRYGARMSPVAARRLAFVILALYAISDEFHQSFVPGRSATLYDWIFDLLGAILAWRALLWWERR